MSTKKKVCVSVYRSTDKALSDIFFLKFQGKYYPFSTPNPKNTAKSLVTNGGYTALENPDETSLTYTGKKFYFDREHS